MYQILQAKEDVRWILLLNTDYISDPFVILFLKVIFKDTKQRETKTTYLDDIRNYFI